MSVKKLSKKWAVLTLLSIILAVVCITVLSVMVIPNSKYNKAVSIMEQERYEEAKVIFQELNGYKDSVKQIQNCDDFIDKNNSYSKAMTYIENKDYISAYEVLDKLGNYKDSVNQKNSIKKNYRMSLIKNAKVGDTITFGNYEQDGNTSNGKEEIEWIVLDKKEDKAFIISKYILDNQPYNKINKDVTWEICSLRQWLNTTFLNSAFNTTEQGAIEISNVSAHFNEYYPSINPGNSTLDSIFLLSLKEAKQYFSSDSSRQCKATAYAVKNGIYVADGEYGDEGYSMWYLRTPGLNQDWAAMVSTHGSWGNQCAGNVVDSESMGIRPVLWINIKNLNREKY